MNNYFSENLKKIRKENNLSQEQLADCLGVSRQAISKWESAVAYPEMDKIIALCDKFNLNIDDLLHKDIKEVKGEEESRKKINNIVDDFLRFIKNTINMFSDMSFKSKMKCLFEQIGIAGLLFLMSLFIYLILNAIFGKIVSFLPYKAYNFVTNFLGSIIIIALLIVAVVVITYIFKTRYLDYYEKIKNENSSMNIVADNSSEKETKKDGTSDKDNKLSFKENKNKVIIRDSQDSEYRFINCLFKAIIAIIKFFLLCFGLFVAIVLICLFGAFVISFMLSKTGFFFVGLLVTILSSAVITVIILLLIINFVFNRKNDKKKMIWSFIISLVTFGIGCGLIFIGTISFDVMENDQSLLKVVTKEYNMKDNLLIYPHAYYDIEYVKADNSNIKIEYTINKYCEIDDSFDNSDNTIDAWARCENITKLVREAINNANEKKIVPINDGIEKMTIYTAQANIDKLKNNWANHLKEIEKNEKVRRDYEDKINELEEENYELQRKIDNLQEQSDN